MAFFKKNGKEPTMPPAGDDTPIPPDVDKRIKDKLAPEIEKLRKEAEEKKKQDKDKGKDKK